MLPLQPFHPVKVLFYPIRSGMDKFLGFFKGQPVRDSNPNPFIWPHGDIDVLSPLAAFKQNRPYAINLNGFHIFFLTFYPMRLLQSSQSTP
jgi:hypothetical protein